MSNAERCPPMAPPAGGPLREPRDAPLSANGSVAAAVYAAQFGTACNRLLIVHDDLVGKGFGWSARYWSTALLAAAGARRTLHEAPTPITNLTLVGSPYRWCTVPPFTNECFYQRWNDCDSTPDHEHAQLTHRHAHHTWGMTGLRHPAYDKQDVLHMELSDFKPEYWPHHNFAQEVAPLSNNSAQELSLAIVRLLFRPRHWVRTIADCVLRQAGIGMARVPHPAPPRAMATRAAAVHAGVRGGATRATAAGIMSARSGGGGGREHVVGRDAIGGSDAADGADGASRVAQQQGGDSVVGAPEPYLVIFMRDSVEKREELRSHAHGAPAAPSKASQGQAINRPLHRRRMDRS